MDKRETVIGHLGILRTWCAVNPKYGMALSVEDCDKAVGWLDDAISLLKEQEQKYRECGEATSKAIQELQTKLKAQEPVEPTTKNGAYFCGNPHCRKIIAQMVPCGVPTHRVKYCSECGMAVKWE